jgi:hypothetical protein
MENLVFSDKYAVEHEIARGGMGVVYKAVHTALNRVVALKVLHSQYSGDPSFVQRFLREARAMARLDHNNIIRVFDVAEDAGHHYIVMEYFPAIDLKRVILDQSRPALPEVLSIARQIAQGLAYAHSHGIVHRDIKPGNVMVDERGHVKIADFGIAAAADEISVTATGQVLGTPEYMAPEQARGEELDGRCDLYSLGMVLYELLTGRTPFPAVSKMAIVGKLLYEEGEFELSFGAEVPDAVRELVAQLLRKNREDRVPDALTLIARLEALEQALAEGGLPAGSAPAEADAGGATVVLSTPASGAAATGTGQAPTSGPFATGPAGTGAFAPGTSPAYTTGGTPAPAAPGAASRTPLLAGIGAAVVLVLAGVGYLALSGGKDEPAPAPVAASAPAASPPAAPAAPAPELVREVEALDQTLSRLAARAGDARRDAEAVDAGSHAADTFDRAGRDAADGAARAEAGRASLAGGRYEEARARMVEGQSLLAAAIDGFGKARDDAQARIEAERKAEEARRAAEEKRRADARRAARRRAEQEAAAKPAPAPPVEVAGVTAAGKPDIEVVGEMLAMFKTAYEHRDLDTMQEVSQITRDRRQFLEEIFRTYSTVEVKITGFNMVGDTATAVVSIERLQAPDGNIAIPSDQWRAAELTIHKAGGRWRKIVW